MHKQRRATQKRYTITLLTKFNHKRYCSGALRQSTEPADTQDGVICPPPTASFLVREGLTISTEVPELTIDMIRLPRQHPRPPYGCFTAPCSLSQRTGREARGGASGGTNTIHDFAVRLLTTASEGRQSAVRTEAIADGQWLPSFYAQAAQQRGGRY